MEKRIHYVLKAAKHFGDEPYMDFFLEREVNPLLLEFKQNGSDVPDKKVMLIRETETDGDFSRKFVQCWQRWYLQRDLV